MTRRPMIGETREVIPRRLTLLITVLIVVGIVGTGASVIGAQTTSAASKADVERNTDLTTQVKGLADQIAELTADQAKAGNLRADAAETRQITTCARLADVLRALDEPVVGLCPSNPVGSTVQVSPTPR